MVSIHLLSPLNVLLFLSGLLFIQGQQVFIETELLKGQTTCMSEYFPENTMVILDISTEAPEVSFEVKRPDTNMVAAAKNKPLKKAFTASETGYYEICMYNFGAQTANIIFDMKYGVSARDYSSVAKAKDLKPIEVELQRISDKKKLMNHYIRVSNQLERAFESYLDSISSKIVFYSVVLMIIMVAIGIVETFYLKKFMAKRKLI
jgi:hypothetical protein